MKTQPLMTEIFINEFSLQAQFQSISEFETAIVNFIALIDEIKAKNNFNGDFYRGNIFINFQAIKNENFQKTFNQLKQADKVRFKNLLTKGFKDWQNQQLHQMNDNYILIGTLQNITNTSIAEVTERKIQNSDIAFLLINFVNSTFNVCHKKYSLCQIIAVSKNGQTPIELDCLDNKDAFEQWVQDKLDTRNFLEKNPERFQKTQETFQGASIYIESKIHKYWYLDNLHKNHFEVFNKEGNHLGEANLNGEIDTNKCDDKKKLKIS
jgi:hypothetical protein